MTGTGSITSQLATNCGLKTNEVSLDIQVLISREYKSMDSLSCFAETKIQSNKKANGFQSVNCDNLKPDILGRTGSRITINTEDTGRKALRVMINNCVEMHPPEKLIPLDLSFREERFAMAFIFRPCLVAFKTLNSKMPIKNILIDKDKNL